MERGIPGSGFVLIRDSSHGTAGKQPEAFNGAVLSFLADVEADRLVADRA